MDSYSRVVMQTRLSEGGVTSSSLPPSHSLARGWFLIQRNVTFSLNPSLSLHVILCGSIVSCRMLCISGNGTHFVVATPPIGTGPRIQGHGFRNAGTLTGRGRPGVLTGHVCVCCCIWNRTCLTVYFTDCSHTHFDFC